MFSPHTCRGKEKVPKFMEGVGDNGTRWTVVESEDSFLRACFWKLQLVNRGGDVQLSPTAELSTYFHGSKNNPCE